MIIEKKFFFLAGIPRSGSTVLASILNQNPALYVTPTSPMLDLLFLNEQEWRQLPSVKQAPDHQQVLNISNAIINGCWEHVPQNIIIDKHRAWGRNLSIIPKVFNQEPKLLLTVRDIPATIASFITLTQKHNGPTILDQMLAERGLLGTMSNKVGLILENFIADPLDSARTAFVNHRKNVCLIEYDKLMQSPDETLAEIYEFLEIPLIKHDLNNIVCQTQDDDLVAWGMSGLHQIRSTLKSVAKNPAEVIGQHLVDRINSLKLEFWKN